jgi:hypothetical protein
VTGIDETLCLLVAAAWIVGVDEPTLIVHELIRGIVESCVLEKVKKVAHPAET